MVPILGYVVCAVSTLVVWAQPQTMRRGLSMCSHSTLLCTLEFEIQNVPICHKIVVFPPKLFKSENIILDLLAIQKAGEGLDWAYGPLVVEAQCRARGHLCTNTHQQHTHVHLHKPSMIGVMFLKYLLVSNYSFRSQFLYFFFFFPFDC